MLNKAELFSVIQIIQHNMKSYKQQMVGKKLPSWDHQGYYM